MPIELEQREWREERALPHDIARRQLLLALHPHQPERPDRMNHTPEALQLANQLEANYAHVYAGLAPAAAAALRSQHARIADLEAQLYAIGAGGVGQSIKPQIQADTSPAAWAIYSDDGTAIRLWSKDKATAQDAADKFGLPLVPLYTAPQPTRQPLTDEKLYALYCEAMKGYYVSALHYWRETEAHKFARAIEAVVANQPHRQPLTEEQIKAAVRHLYGSDAVAAMAVTGDIETARAIEAAHGITGGQP